MKMKDPSAGRDRRACSLGELDRRAGDSRVLGDGAATVEGDVDDGCPRVAQSLGA
jgi:hypothetical protein